jgi:hypothetical protein
LCRFHENDIHQRRSQNAKVQKGFNVLLNLAGYGIGRKERIKRIIEANSHWF